jgi:hypothetical protein
VYPTFIFTAKTQSTQRVYFVAENLVLWARSETIGYAVNICHGMMEYWNDGILECWNTGFSGIGSIFIRMARIRIKNQTIIHF